MAPQGIFSLMLRACFLGVGPEQLLAFHAQKGQCLFECCAITILTFLIILSLTCVLQQKRGAHLCVHHFFLPHSCILFMMSQTTTFVWTLHVWVGVMGDSEWAQGKCTASRGKWGTDSAEKPYLPSVPDVAPHVERRQWCTEKQKIKTKRKEPYHILSYLCSFPVLPNHSAEMLLQKEKERDSNPQFLFPSQSFLPHQKPKERVFGEKACFKKRNKNTWVTFVLCSTVLKERNSYACSSYEIWIV